MVFIHIGKTAGTSLRNTLIDSFGSDACSPPFVQTYMTADEAARLEKYPIVCGHISRVDQKRWFPARDVLVTLRDPIDRGLSFLHYVRALPAESSQVAADAQQLSMLDLIETEEAQRNLNNTMVRQLGGHMLDPADHLDAMFEAAKETLKGALWVGRQERFQADLGRLSAVLGVTLKPQLANITQGRVPRERDDADVIRRITELAEYDLELWSWAESLFEH